jgi:CRISPR-associated protein Cmr6
MANLSWLFYKDYYEGFQFWLSQGKENQKEIEFFFEGKNKQLCNSELVHLPDTPFKKLEFTTTYPGLLIGSGYAHETGKTGEFKLGFQFDHTTGMPVIPGSSVKGVIRAAFPQFDTVRKEPWKRNLSEKATDIKKEKARYIGKQLLGWSEESEDLFDKVHLLEQHIFEGLNIELSLNEKLPVFYSLYERDIFYDAFPVKGGGDNEKKIIGKDAITPHPHPLKNPVPLPFIKILSGVTIHFHFMPLAPDYQGVNWDIRLKLYHDILAEFGVGAKTNVGYGQLIAKPYILKTYDAAHSGLPYAILRPPAIKIPKR